MTTNKPPVTTTDVLWSVQRALLGEVLPQLRAVTVAVEDGIRLRFIYDCPIDEDLRTITATVDGEVDADFWRDTTVESVTETQLDGPIEITASETPAYHRREPDPLLMTAASKHPGAHPSFLGNRESLSVVQTRRTLGRLAVQAALLGEVTPDLRYVIIDPIDGVGVRMIYDRPIDAEIEATVQRVHTATKANLYLDETVVTRAECVSEGRAPRFEGQMYAFERKEGQ